MLREELEGIRSGRKELREFGLVMGGACLVVGGLLLWRQRSAWPWFFWGAGAFALLGLAAPSALRPLQRAWMALAVVMGFVMSRVILTFLFFLVITPIALVGRVVGKRFLDPGPDKSLATYWRPRPPEERTPEDYEKQF